MNVIDLFSGVGGLSLGAARAGFNILGSVENDLHAINAHKINFPSTRHLQIDIAQTNGKQILSKLNISKYDICGIIGGPPCQGFSTIGHQNISDPRNQLFVKFFELIRDIQPSFFLAENVPGIMNDINEGLRNKAFSYVLDDYKLLPPLRLSANEHGTPTVRSRYIFIGYKQEKLNELNTVFEPVNNKVFVKDALYGLPRKINPKWQTEKQSWRKVTYNDDRNLFNESLRGRIPKGVGDSMAISLLKEKSMVSGFLGTIHSTEVSNRYATIKQGETDKISKSKRLELDGFCPTLRAGTGSDKGSFQAVRPLHPTVNRVITPREAARLQGFPDWYQFSPTKWHSFRQIGNSVCPLLAEKVLKHIFQSLK